jgi:hemolysin activation/secretion protein
MVKSPRPVSRFQSFHLFYLLSLTAAWIGSTLSIAPAAAALESEATSPLRTLTLSPELGELGAASSQHSPEIAAVAPVRLDERLDEANRLNRSKSSGSESAAIEYSSSSSASSSSLTDALDQMLSLDGFSLDRTLDETLDRSPNSSLDGSDAQTPRASHTPRSATEFTSTLLAQRIPSNLPLPRPGEVAPEPDAPSRQDLPEPQIPQLPSPDQLLPGQTPSVGPGDSPDAPAMVRVERFQLEGVSERAFSSADRKTLEDSLAELTGRELTFAELLQARSLVTQFYVDRGYVTSGAFIPPQTLDNGVVIIQVVEGTLEDINVSGLERLQRSYVRDRLRLAARTPLNVDRLLEGLQLLQLDPLIGNISADLQAGTQPGTSVLEVTVREADTLNTQFSFNNARSPSVGSFRRQVQLTQANLFGFGDEISAGYSNTDGSDGFDLSYSLPLNPRNGKLRLAAGFTDSRVIEDPFDELDITATSRYYELSFRQPIVQTPGEELALGLTFSRQESQTELGINDIGPFALSPGADDQGRTRVSALRFFQEWTQRDSRQVLAARSQFSLGLDAFDATVNDSAPDSRFFSWRGQGQWVRLLAPDTLLLVRGDVQLADRDLLPLEQFGLGGQESVRGYRQDALLTDNGALLSTEVRIPILRLGRRNRGVVQIVPFIDFGTAWNNKGDDPEPNQLVGTGLGLLWRQGNNFTARLDWGIPLVDVDSNKRTWQENGLYFSVVYTPF